MPVYAHRRDFYPDALERRSFRLRHCEDQTVRSDTEHVPSRTRRRRKTSSLLAGLGIPLFVVLWREDLDRIPQARRRSIDARIGSSWFIKIPGARILYSRARERPVRKGMNCDDQGENRAGTGILKEEGIDLWLTFVRESEVTGDPSLDLILGANCTWHSAFMIPAEGKAVAIVGSLDETRIRETGGYEVIGYTKSIKEPLLEQINRFSPRSIAINFSENTCLADGLSHGLYLSLVRYLEGTPFADRLVSSENIISKLRGRKSPEEIRRIRAAVELTEEIFAHVSRIMKPGLTEKDVAAFILPRWTAAASRRRGSASSARPYSRAPSPRAPTRARRTARSRRGTFSTSTSASRSSSTSPTFSARGISSGRARRRRRRRC